MGQQGLKVVHKVSHPVGHASRRQHEHSLLVFLVLGLDLSRLVDVHVIRLALAFL
jgi:hypothetical protein